MAPEEIDIIETQRVLVQDLIVEIEQVRSALRKGMDASRFADRYLATVRHSHDLRLKAEALGMDTDVGLLGITAPLPFRYHFVGHTAEQVRALEWKQLPDIIRRRLAA